ncbi:MAG TPA: glycosyltransferase family 39 protein [Pseudolabrys sp.]|nr:glycosyltransferase family 39 protein [Pseudolabrys sp.]
MAVQLPFTIKRPAVRLREALTDPARRERTFVVALVLYAIVWTCYGAIAKSPQGLHPDMTELIAWSRDPAFGYLKHPPFAAWLTAFWFSVWPFGAWFYYLLAMLMPALTLWLIWRMSADYLSVEKRIAGVALLTLVPFFNFHALKYNVNTVLMPLWALTTWCFLRSYRGGSLGYAALAGAAAALCMLTKYWSVFLLAGLALAALVDARRAKYFRSPAPWVTILVGCVVLVPHLYWLTQHAYAPFAYAVQVHGDKDYGASALSALSYLGGSVAYVIVPLAVALAVTPPSRKAWANVVWPAQPERRLAAAAFWGPLLLPVAAAFAGAEITSLWSMSAWSLLPVLLFSSPMVKVRSLDNERVLLAAIALPLAMLIASPMVAIVEQREAPPPERAQAQLLAAQIDREWHGMTAEPLRYIGGDSAVADAAAAYATDAPLPLHLAPGVGAAQLARSGAALVCFAEDRVCRKSAAVQAAKIPGSRTIASDITRDFLGFRGKPQRYTIVLLPPRP